MRFGRRDGCSPARDGKTCRCRQQKRFDTHPGVTPYQLRRLTPPRHVLLAAKPVWATLVTERACLQFQKFSDDNKKYFGRTLTPQEA